MTDDAQAQSGDLDAAVDDATVVTQLDPGTDDTMATQPDPGADDAAQRPLTRRLLARWRVTTLALVTLAAVGVTVGYFFLQYRPDQQTDDAASKAVLQAAYDGTMALLTYSPETFDAQMEAAKSHLTGEFLTYYGRFTDQVMGPAVKQRGVQASARVVRGAVAELHPDSAVALLFVDQTNASKERPEPGFSASCVRVTLAKVNDSWLISKFEPV